MHAFVLRYRLLPSQFPAPLQDARAGLERTSARCARPGRRARTGRRHRFQRRGNGAGLLLAGTVPDEPGRRAPR
ncbi:MAG TPA: hypothetical protein VE645_15485 [Pseudonocardiaceae bacterium]|nr:hypothetical protein [Pseudonocardiaceae bacterium]